MTRILVAEDSFALANLLRFVLMNAGYDVDLQRTGSSALQAAQTNKYDLMILDQQMPHLTGLEVIAEVRRESNNSGTPVFLCTAKTHELDLEEIIGRLGVSRIIHKPFSPRELIELVTTATQPLHAV